MFKKIEAHKKAKGKRRILMVRYAREEYGIMARYFASKCKKLICLLCAHVGNSKCNLITELEII